MIIDNKYIVNKNPTGNDVIKGGVFFGSNLTPSGSFSNIPQYIASDKILSKEPALMLTLQKVKDSLNNTIKQQTGATTTSDNTLESYLYDFVNLLIDYRDIRNYVFYGSANTEIAYNINYIIENYPYNTLVGQPYGTNFIQITNYIEDSKEKTEIIFPETYYYSPDNYVRIILDNYNRFNFFDDASGFNWSDYQIVDKNGKRYNIDYLVTPYKSPSIFTITDIINVTLTSGLINYNAIQFTTSIPHNYQVKEKVLFKDLLCVNPSLILKFYVQIFNGTGYDNYYYNLNNTEFEVVSVSSTTFTIRRADGVLYESIYVDTLTLSPFYDNSNPGYVRVWPAPGNTRPYVLKIIIDGGLPEEALMDFVLNNESKKGFIIAPNISILNDWNVKLSPIQNMLLAPSPINPTPWPRRPFTNNIMNILDDNPDSDDYQFVLWLKDPSSLYVRRQTDDVDVDAAWMSYGLDYETNMIRALALDETETNQLVRRCIPGDIINEIYDTDDHYFQRFILVAGWLFDQIRLYSKFIKYAHTVDTTDYNQLSPEYYRYLSDYWGLDLFGNDETDFSKLVIQTVPGQYFGVSQDQIEANKYYQKTLKQVQEARQKNLLMSLLFLYKQKGTQGAINTLIALLGAPDGFLKLDEYAFEITKEKKQVFSINNVGLGSWVCPFGQVFHPDVSAPNGAGYCQTLGSPAALTLDVPVWTPGAVTTTSYIINSNSKRIVDNEKVHVPSISFEIDPDYLLDKINIDNTINKPYTYRMALSNDNVYNLRELTVLTDPNGAIDTQIIDAFGSQTYNYISFGKGEFANLQKANDKYFLLPLSLPDRFFGLSLEYMIPRDGMMKGIGSNQEEAICDIFSLYRIEPTNLNPTVPISNIAIDGSYTVLTITTVNPHGFYPNNNVFVSNVVGINKLNDKMFEIVSVIDAYNFTVFGDFSGVYVSGGQVVSGLLNMFDNTGNDGLQFTYPLAIHYNERNRTIDTSFALDSHSHHIPSGYTNPNTDFNLLQVKYPSATYVEDSYIITRLEGNDLVIRLKIQSEISGSYSERCAMFEDVFDADGLNHSIRLILREDGVEIYKDYSYIGIAKWLNISNAGPYLAYEIPKSEIKSLLNSTDACTNYWEPINVNDFIAHPNIYHTNADAINWWDLFIGMPNNVKFNFKKLNFFDEAAVNDFNIGDRMKNNTDNNTAEFYLFEVANPTLHSRTFEELNDFNVPSVFYELFPNALPVYYGYALPEVQDQYSRDIIKDLALTNKRCYSDISNNLLLNHKQDFFKFDDVFGNNAWMSDIHKSYTYDLFDGLIDDLYILYGAHVLTYAGLEEFMDLVEQKFRSTFRDFIPIVINIDEFGRLIKNSLFYQPKNRIPGNDKVCQMQYNATPATIVTQLFKKSYTDLNGLDNSSFIFSLQTNTGTIIIPPTIVPWVTDQYLTLTKFRDIFNTAPIVVGGHAQADVYSFAIRIKVDYDWFFSTYSVSPNSLQLFVQQGSRVIEYNFANGTTSEVGIHSAVYDSCGRLISDSYTDIDTCGVVSYTLPNHKPRPPYIYYEIEHKPPMYVHYSTEVGTEPVIVHFSNE